MMFRLCVKAHRQFKKTTYNAGQIYPKYSFKWHDEALCPQYYCHEQCHNGTSLAMKSKGHSTEPREDVNHTNHAEILDAMKSMSSRANLSDGHVCAASAKHTE